MLSINIDEVTNGYVVVVFDTDDGKYLINEFVERKIDALSVLHRFIGKLMQQETMELFKLLKEEI